MKRGPEIIIAQSESFYAPVLKISLEKHGVYTIAEAWDGYALLDLMANHRPDLVLLTLTFPNMNGSLLFNILKKFYPELKIVILSMFSAEELVHNYIRRGARGFIFKDSLSGDLGNLADAIKEVASGSGYYFLDRFGLRYFTNQETQVVIYLCKGKTSGQIAAAMKLSEKAIEKHRRNIYRKTNSKNAAEFFKYAFTGGLELLG